MTAALNKAGTGDGGNDCNISRVKSLLRRLRTSARKALGQNFLVDDGVRATILDAAHLSVGDTVVEVGPGLGVLTRAIAEIGCRVIAVELDDTLASMLEKSLGNWPHVRVLRGDVLSLHAWAEVGPGLPYKVVSNLPYNIASPTLRRFLESPRKPSLLVVMVQEEVAEQIAAKPGKMRLLSAIVQYYASAEIIDRVSPESFFPMPKVSSAVLRLTPHLEPPVKVGDTSSFFSLVAAGFRQPRKQLSNSLSHGLGVSAIQATEHLAAAGIDSHRRAETLSLQEWAGLWKTVYPEEQQ
ncbi:MAG: 16S rRNA (adenine(1518)-N(6)/adenine(1519)-N(6))-dimethyltransferase RsmA [Dehalococcoidia bacterium]|nr:16S rRNA (adenine(1518)-N(6)/adenine(1519)-N(6))-dimethyltransferase RsmA [Dehalococcoidia bacterium]